MLKYSAFAFLIVVATWGCKQAATEADKKAEAAATPSKLETVVLKKDTLETTIVIPSELVPYQQVDLYAKVTGFVKELKVDIGSKVKAGQVLIILEAPELTAQLSAAQSRLKSQEATYTASLASYNRLLETSKTPGTISPNDLEQAEARRDADLANLEAARASQKEVNDVKDYLTIRAPFDGTITARNVNTGAYVGPSGRGSEMPTLTLQEQDKLRLVIAVPETYSGYLGIGDQVEFKARSRQSEVFKTTLTRLSGALDQKLRSQRVEADIKNTDGKFLAGTVADVTIRLQSSADSFIVPKSSVVSTAEGMFVIRVVDQKAERVPIRKGLQRNDVIEIFGNLAMDDVILKKGSEEFRTGDAVN